MQDLLLELTTGDIEDRVHALSRVEATDDYRIVSALIDLAENPAVGSRDLEATATAIGTTQHPAAIGYLKQRLRSEEASDREFAAIGLGYVEDRDSVPLLVGLLEDPANSVRNVAERSLIRTPETTRQHGADALLKLLAHPVPLTRSPAARLLGLVREPRALQPLIEQLQQDRQWLARMWAAKGLGDLGSTEALDPLIQALRSDEKNRVRAAAVEAIAKLKPKNVKPLLEEALADEDGGVKRLAEECLSKLGHDAGAANEF